jgi:hypothetical protein
MVRKHTAEVVGHWSVKDICAFWADHDVCVRQCLRFGGDPAAIVSVATLRTQLSKLTARNLRSFLISLLRG